MTIVASKWSQSLKNLEINASAIGNIMSKCLVLSADLHEVQTFHLKGRMGDVSLNVDDDVRRLAMSWTKLKTFQSSSAQPNVYFLVNFEDNRGELS